MNNTKGLDVLVKYLDANSIKYDIEASDGEVNNTILFVKDGLEFSALVDDTYILASADAVQSLPDDKKLLKQVQEYIHRCNHSYRFAKFDYLEKNISADQRIICTSERWFSDSNIVPSVIGSIEAIIEMNKQFVPSIKEVIECRG